MAAPFPEANFEALIYMVLGALITLVIVLGIYVRRLRKKIENIEDGNEEEHEDLRVDNIGLSKKSQDVMKIILEEPMLQSDMTDELGVSKATVSNAISELKDRRLIKRKKRANTYLIEPDIEELEDQQK